MRVLRKVSPFPAVRGAAWEKRRESIIRTMARMDEQVDAGRPLNDMQQYVYGLCVDELNLHAFDADDD